MNIRRITEVFDDFECSGLLPLDAVGIYGIHNRHAVNASELPHNTQGIVKVSTNRDNFGTVNKSLRQFANGYFPSGQNHSTLDSRPSGISRSGRTGIACGGTDDHLGAVLNSLGNGYRHTAILEGTCRVQTLKF